MLIIGCGYIGKRVAQALKGQGQAMVSVVRSTASMQILEEEMITALACDLDCQNLPTGSTQDKNIFYFAPPPAAGTQDTRIEKFIQQFSLSGQPKRIVYLSTTGVYGDCQGSWVDETWPAKPRIDRAKRRWHAEQSLQSWKDSTKSELVILRVAGIYGPGRLPLSRLQKQIPMVAESDAPWTNRIHADDLVQACIAAMQKGKNGEVYNACDGAPGNMTDYFNRVADMANLPRPPLISMQQAREKLSAGLLSYLAESRRLSNHKLREELGVKLRYPSLQLGLPDCFND